MKKICFIKHEKSILRTLLESNQRGKLLEKT